METNSCNHAMYRVVLAGLLKSRTKVMCSGISSGCVAAGCPAVSMLGAVRSLTTCCGSDAMLKVAFGCNVGAGALEARKLRSELWAQQMVLKPWVGQLSQFDLGRCRLSSFGLRSVQPLLDLLILSLT